MIMQLISELCQTYSWDRIQQENNEYSLSINNTLLNFIAIPQGYILQGKLTKLPSDPNKIENICKHSLEMSLKRTLIDCQLDFPTLPYICADEQYLYLELKLHTSSQTLITTSTLESIIKDFLNLHETWQTLIEVGKE